MRTEFILLFPTLILAITLFTTWRQRKVSTTLSSVTPEIHKDADDHKATTLMEPPQQPSSSKTSDASHLQLPPLYKYNPSKYFTEDCVSTALRDQLSISLFVDPAQQSSTPHSSLFAKLNDTFHSLVLLPELRSCHYTLYVTDESQHKWNTTMKVENHNDPILAKLLVVGVASSVWATSVLTQQKEFTLVMPFNYALDVELRLYNLLQSLCKRPKIVLQHLDLVIVPITEVPSLTSAFLLSKTHLPTRAIKLDLPVLGHQVPVSHPLEWVAVTRKGKHYSDKQRNECLASLLCKTNVSNFWLCNGVSPLLHGDPDAYMMSDCMSEYLKERLTVLITAHVAPSNPNPFLLRVLLQSLHLMPEIRHTRKLIVYDGVPVNKTAKLKATIAAVQTMLKSGSPIVHNTEVVHLAEQGKLRKTTEYGIANVKTPFVMITQPDLPFLRAPNLYYLIRSFEADSKLSYVRFNRAPNHQSKFDYWVSTNVPKSSWVPLCRTPVFSSENHLVPTSLYTKVIFPTMKDGKFTRWGMSHCRTMECLMNKRSSKASLFGTFIYGNIGDGPYAVHLDGSERHQKIPAELLKQL